MALGGHRERAIKSGSRAQGSNPRQTPLYMEKGPCVNTGIFIFNWCGGHLRSIFDPARLLSGLFAEDSLSHLRLPLMNQAFSLQSPRRSKRPPENPRLRFRNDPERVLLDMTESRPPLWRSPRGLGCKRPLPRAVFFGLTSQAR